MLENLREIVKFRALISALVARHLSMRYRGSMLGFLWSFLNPLCLMLVYTLVFRYYIRFSGVENYTIFMFCGLLPWIWFSSGLLEGTSSIVASGHLITKSMFPAHILPLVSVLTCMINFLLSLPLLFIFIFAAGLPFHATLLMLPLCIVIQMIFIFGMSLALGSINVQFRDVQHILGNFLTFLFFLCPVVYSASTVPQRFRFTLELNPFASLIMMYHSLIMDGVIPPLWDVAYVAAWALLSLLIGNFLYNRYRDSFAELL
ncbi:MAG: ABC transporter permease [Deltaproteobacteria bacterium]|nr:ABC transporter permease [Deltaproteobacteria bacterium]